MFYGWSPLLKGNHFPNIEGKNEIQIHRWSHKIFEEEYGIQPFSIFDDEQQSHSYTKDIYIHNKLYILAHTNYLESAVRN